ncbi:hypothetical protein CRE_07492 [Caenorhabditis remanei]|uniref:RING-type domain-containing protein n=1 Tax=Caenorhabditis remanei TaxID=31234 RepID=E3M2W8_CAERE|nr:hypothetical protein CRE_07492 [Caenorhabditis remanei]
MYGFFRRFIPKDKEKAEKRKVEKNVDESEVCVIDVETLRCVICLNIFQGIPRSLTCGHSFCPRCIDEVAHSEQMNEQRNAGRNHIQCPICRKRASMHKLVHNYALKNILDSINELAKEEEKARTAFDNTLEASNEQLRSKCIEFEKINDGLKKEMNERRRKEYYNYVAITLFVIFYIVLTTAFGN